MILKKCKNPEVEEDDEEEVEFRGVVRESDEGEFGSNC